MHVSVDYAKFEAIRTEGGCEERAKLMPCLSTGFASCTWADGTTFQSQVANLTLETKVIKRTKKKKKKKGPVRKKPAKEPDEVKSSETEDEGEESESDEADDVESPKEKGLKLVDDGKKEPTTAHKAKSKKKVGKLAKTAAKACLPLRHDVKKH